MNDTAEKLEENIEDTAEVVENDEKFDIEIVDDTPEEERVPKRKETSEADNDTDNDDEIKNYSEGVQKRISKLKYEFHEERRAKEEAKRMQDEAISYAEKLKKDNESLRKTIADGESMLIDQAKGRVGAELEKAKTDYKEAYEYGAPDKLIEAQE